MSDAAVSALSAFGGSFLTVVGFIIVALIRRKRAGGNGGSRVILETSGQVQASPITIAQHVPSLAAPASTAALPVGQRDDVHIELVRLSESLRSDLRQKDQTLERLSDKRADDGKQMVADTVRQLERIGSVMEQILGRLKGGSQSGGGQ